jgi:hypothetical protein
MGKIATFLLGVLLFALGSVSAFDHSTVIDKYEGSKTCIGCHEDEVKDVFNSFHYQWAGEITDIAGKGSVVHGKRYAYNDFCGAVFYNGEVPINWIGNATLKKPPEGKEELKGKVVGQGCSTCHIGLGLVPSKEPTQEQLENIDCFICHVPGYDKKSRILVKEGDKLKRIPNPNLDYKELAKKIQKKPAKENCLTCHAFSGGGPGFKRPNLEPALIGNVSESIDVHMARGLNCVDCHPVKEHKFGVKAMDTWVRELEERPSCENCHTDAPHGNDILNKHTKTVACQTCHIPKFAKKFKIDVKRDWSGKAEFNEKLGRWEPEIELGGNVTPVYSWWNSKDREAYLYPEPLKLENGKFYFFKPVGSIDDPGSKIYPFKYHETVVPIDKEKNIPVPVKVGVVFATGNTTLGIMKAAQQSGLKFTGDFVTEVRYMAINHGVEPKENALQCNDCHGGNRLDWTALGYKGDPMQVGGRFKAEEVPKEVEKPKDVEKPEEEVPPEKKGICGPSMLIGIALIPLAIYASIRRSPK